MKILILTFLAFIMIATPAKAQGLSIIRDTEIENLLEKWAEPILRQAGLTTDQVRLVLVDSDEVNAFVAGGSNIFIYAGLIQKAEYPEEVIGVLAHEAGHITGGHLIASRRAIEKASYQSILATALGIGAAIATGDAGAASALSIGGSGLAQRGFFGHSRIQESATDQAGLKYLDGANINPQGLVSFLEKLEGQELLPASQQSEYMRTHPLTRDRIETMRQGANQSASSRELGESIYQNDFDRMKAKLLAFRSPHIIPKYYRSDSNETIDLYANAIMNYRQKNYDGALDIFDVLLRQEPTNPYFHEMKAQILRDAGRLDESEQAYKKALSLLNNDAPLVNVNLAHVMIEQQNFGEEPENLLLSAIQNEVRDTRAFRLLATISGRNGREGDAQYYLAEEAAAQGNNTEARRLLELAEKNTTLSDKLKIKVLDLKKFLDGLPDNG